MTKDDDQAEQRPSMPPDPFPADCPGCRDGSDVHVGHGLIIEGDDRLRLAE